MGWGSTSSREVWLWMDLYGVGLLVGSLARVGEECPGVDVVGCLVSSMCCKKAAAPRTVPYLIVDVWMLTYRDGFVLSIWRTYFRRHGSYNQMDESKQQQNVFSK